MNGYICFYQGKKWETQAETIFEAQRKAIEYFHPPKSKRHLVHAELAEKNGEQVTKPLD